MPADGGETETLTFSQHLACPTCGTSYDEPAPRNFSFNSPYGACETCDGLGTTFEVDPELVIPDPDQSINDGAIAPWRSAHTQYFTRMLEAVAEDYEHRPRRAVGARSPPSSRRSSCTASRATSRSSTRTATAAAAQYSTDVRGRDPVDQAPPRGRRERLVPRAVRGLHARGAVHARATAPGSSRRRWRSRSTTSNIAEVCDMSIGESAKFLAALELSERDRLIAERVTKEINARLGFLLDVGLDYLTLSRSAGTLAGGEAQRIRLASQIGSGLVGTLYVLDEPSIGLHQRDNRRLIDTLHATARPRQHRARRRARRGDDPRERLDRRHRSGRRRARRRGRLQRPGQGHHEGQGVDHRPVPRRQEVDPGAAAAPSPGARDGSTIKGAREHNLRDIDVRDPARLLRRRSPACRGSGK